MGNRKIYLITGAAGHLGSTLVRQLNAAGAEVRALLLPGERLPDDCRAESFTGNVCRPETMEAFFTVPDDADAVVIHCAGIVSIATKYDQKVYDVNVTGTKNVVELARTHQASRLIYVSSVHAIPEQPKGTTVTETDRFDPEKVRGLYAKTKAEATAYVLAAAERGLNASVVQPSGILGPYDRGHGHINAMIVDYMKHTLTAAIRGGYDFVDVRDVAAGILACAKQGRKGECYILSNQFYPVTALLDDLHRITGERPVKTVLPLWFARFTAPLAETYYKIVRQPPLYTRYSIYTLQTNAVFSHEKASKELGYSPRPMRDTLSDTVSWLRKAGVL